MSFTDIKTKSQGFTIVELLIVVVVIAILAAITIVSYTGITNRANAATSQETASNLVKKAETFAADGTTGTYPRNLSDLTAAGNSWTTPAMWATGGTAATTNTAVTASTPANQVQYFVCGRTNTAATAPATISAITVVTGGIVANWNYGSPAAVTYTPIGSGAPTTIALATNTTGANGTTTAGTSPVTVGGTTTNFATTCFAPQS